MILRPLAYSLRPGGVESSRKVINIPKGLTERKRGVDVKYLDSQRNSLSYELLASEVRSVDAGCQSRRTGEEEVRSEGV